MFNNYLFNNCSTWNIHIMKKFKANIVDVVKRNIFEGELEIAGNRIKAIRSISEDPGKDLKYVLPGLVDSHVHIESSMLIPTSFSQAVFKHGTVATVSDPHEIANVLGMEGVNFMIENARESPLKIHFGAPSCVPATNFESSGAKIDSKDIKKLLERPEIMFLSEMMNYPGVVYKDAEVLDKIQYAHDVGKPVDGHSPGLRGEELKKYVSAGIKTDHECFSLEEAIEKIEEGMIIQIREGSAAKNFNSLHKLIKMYPDKVMFCLDDMHPDELLKGHINLLVKRSLEKDYDIFDVLRIATYNPVKFYHLNVGLLQEGDPADFIIVDNFKDFNILETWIEGNNVFKKNETLKEVFTQIEKKPNVFCENIVSEKDISVLDRNMDIKIIRAIDGELVTRKDIGKPKVRNGELISDTEKDILKLVVQNRYEIEKPAIGFVKNFGIKNGGMISTIAHDSHNIICLGTEDRIILELLEWINVHKGGIAFSNGKIITGLPLPVAGIMTDDNAETVSQKYLELDRLVKEAGSKLSAPFMTLSFMSLLVIPEIKLGNKGLFDVNEFDLTDIYLK